MIYRFEFGIRVPVGKLLNTVKQLEDSVNDSMQSFGFSEKMVITSVIPLEMTTHKMPTDSEMRQIREVLQAECAKCFGSATIEYVKSL